MKKLNILIVIFALISLAACSSTTTTTSNNNNTDSGDSSQPQQNIAASNINMELGLAYMKRKNFPRAKQKLIKALQQNPSSPTILDALAYYYEVTGSGQEAEKYYQQAIYMAPNSGRALNNYGAFLCRAKRYQQAEQYLLAAANEQSYTDTAAAYENAGLCAMAIPNDKKAAYYFKRALEQDPTRSISSYELASLSYKHGQYQRAQQYITDYLNNAPANAQSLWLSIRIAKKLNDMSAVLKDGLVLQQKFPKSHQYQLYQQMMKS